MFLPPNTHPVFLMLSPMAGDRPWRDYMGYCVQHVMYKAFCSDIVLCGPMLQVVYILIAAPVFSVCLVKCFDCIL